MTGAKDTALRSHLGIVGHGQHHSEGRFALSVSSSTTRRPLVRLHYPAAPTRIRLRCFLFLSLILALLPGSALPAARRAGAAASGVAATPLPPSGLTTTSLDSTIRANWSPPGDPNVAWQLFSVWDTRGTSTTADDVLVSSKVLGKGAVAADANGVAHGAQYLLKVQSLAADGTLSPPSTAAASPDPQSPMRNAAFFENFDDCMPGDLDPNYFDVRVGNKPNNPQFLATADKVTHFANECHFHTQVFGGSDDAGIFIRPRVPFDFANRTGTFSIEVDLPPTQVISGKWFELNLLRDIPGTESQFGNDELPAGDFPNSLTFAVFHHDDAAAGDARFNLPIIRVNVAGKVQEFTGTTNQYTPGNIRVPVVLKVSQTSAEMFINGVSVVRAAGFTLPFTRGYWSVTHRSTYSNRVFDGHLGLPQLLQTLHWDTLQFDGPAGSYNPLVRAYIQPGCKAVVAISAFNSGVDGCPFASAAGKAITLNIADDVASARSAKLLFYSKNGTAPAGTLSVNGNQMTIPAAPALNYWNLVLNQFDIPTGWLRSGSNQLVFNASNSIAQLELEVIYDTPRAMPPMAMAPMPMLGATNQNLRVEHRTIDPNVQTLTTYLYSQGSSAPVTYTTAVVNPAQTPWLTISSPATGALTSPAAGGQLTPLTLSIDFAALAVQGDLGNGYLGLIKVTGGNMPLYIGVGAFNYGLGSYLPIVTAYPNLTTTFNKGAIPDYHGPGAPGPTPPGPPPDTSAPTVVATSPTSGATGVAPAAAVTASFSEAMDPATISGSTVTLARQGGPAVPAAVAYDPATKTATLTPGAGLEPGSGYTATVKGGAGGAKDLAGNALAADATWSFTIATTAQPPALLPVGPSLPPPGAPVSFPDVPASHPYYEAITQLAARGIIRGYQDGRFGPDDTTLRAQMAALITRAMGWDAEDHGNRFPDRGAVDADLWRNVGTLAFYNVAKGYQDGKYRPTNPVLYAQVISFITRAMVAQGYWQPQPDNPGLYPNVPASSGHRQDLVTYYAYAGAVPGTTPTANWVGWDQPSTRGWFAQALWQAFNPAG